MAEKLLTRGEGKNFGNGQFYPWKEHLPEMSSSSSTILRVNPQITRPSYS